MKIKKKKKVETHVDLFKALKILPLQSQYI